MSERSTRRQTREVRRPSRGRADLSRLRQVSDAEIRRTSPSELAHLPADFWDEAEIVAPTAKRAISLRLDEDVLDWFGPVIRLSAYRRDRRCLPIRGSPPRVPKPHQEHGYTVLRFLAEDLSRDLEGALLKPASLARAR